MAITYIGQSTAAATSVTLPAHSTGDLIVIFSFRGTSATAPTLPAGFTNINNSAANTRGHRLAYKIAASSSETSGTWTNAELLIAQVYRGVNKTSPIGGQNQTTNTTTISYPAVTMAEAVDNSWVAGFVGIRNATQPAETPPTGMVNRSSLTGSGFEVAGHDTNSTTTSWASANGGTAGGNRFVSATFEIKSNVIGNAVLSESSDSINSSTKISIKSNLSQSSENDSLLAFQTVSPFAFYIKNLYGETFVIEEMAVPIDKIVNEDFFNIFNSTTRENDDSLSATSKLTIIANLATTEQNDLVSSSSSARISASFSYTEQNDLSVSSSIIKISGTLSGTEQNDLVFSASRVKINSESYINENSDISSSIGNLKLTSNTEITEEDDVVFASTVIFSFGILRVTEDDDNVTSASRLNNTANSTLIEQNDEILFSSALKITSNCNFNEDDDSVISASKLYNKAYGVLNEANDNVTASSQLINTAYGVLSEANDNVTSSAKLIINAYFISNNEDDVLNSSAKLIINGSVAEFIVTEDDDVLHADQVATETPLIRTIILSTENREVAVVVQFRNIKTNEERREIFVEQELRTVIAEKVL